MRKEKPDGDGVVRVFRCSCSVQNFLVPAIVSFFLGLLEVFVFF